MTLYLVSAFEHLGFSVIYRYLITDIYVLVFINNSVEFLTINDNLSVRCSKYEQSGNFGIC